nr:F-box/kelch-repeat protein At3g23880-like [Ipomoea batatas]
MYVPIEIIRPILLKLKVKALIRCQCVCKEWLSIIQHPDFKLSYRGPRRVLAASSSRTLLDVTSISNSGLRIKTLFQVGGTASLLNRLPSLPRWWTGVWCSCNGLVLFSVRKHIFLWNPSTHCCTKVLDLPLLNNTIPVDVVSGLCYVSSTGDYKAVLLFCRDFDRNVMVASLKNKVWRKVSFPYREYDSGIGVNFRNTLHWRANDSIIYFEAESDEFKKLPTPESHGLGIIDGCLCVVRQGNERGQKVLQVLVMKEYGVKESWVNHFVISTSTPGLSSSTLYSSKCNTKVLICSCCYDSWKILVYDVKNNKLDNHFTEKLKYYNDAAICSYVQTIVSPHEFIWRGDRHNPTKDEFAVSENRSYRWWSGVWCSCNGLVLFSVGKHILLWNPSTRCCTKVLELSCLSNTIPVDVASGLCYVSSTGDYKAVLLFRFGPDRPAMVASLKNKEWRKVPFPFYANSARDGVNFHNTLHWRVNGLLRWRVNGSRNIVYFEAESDEFKELPTPELCRRESAILGLGIMDGCLCMVCEGKERGEKLLQVLVMKEYGVKKSWSIVSPHEFIWRDDQHKSPEDDIVLRFVLEKFNK